MATDYYEYTVLGDYTVALINGDCTGLTDDEVKSLDTFEAEAIRNASRYRQHWHWDIADDAGFAQCEVCELWGECVTLRLVCFDTVRDMVRA